MKKSAYLYSLLVLFIGFVSFSLFALAKLSKKKQNVIKGLKILSNFKATQLNKSVFASNKLSNRPTIIIFFNTECEHCQYEAKEIAQHQSDFKNINLLMISSEEINKIKTFINNYQLNGLVNPLQMDIKTITDSFGAVTIPTILIYDKDRQLIKQYKGETKVESIIKYIK